MIERISPKSFFRTEFLPAPASLPARGTLYQNAPLPKARHFTEEAYANPDFAGDQRRVLDQLTTDIPQNILPPHLYSIYTKRIKIPDNTDIKLPYRTTVKFNATPNGIVTLRELRRLTPWYFPLPIFRVSNYFQVDTKSDKAWDVSTLWNITESEKGQTKPVEVFSFPPIFNAFFAPGERINLFMFNRLSSDSALGRRLARSPKYADILAIADNTIPAHEAGHKWQFKEFFPLDLLPKRPSFMHLKLFLLPFLEKFLPEKGQEVKNELQNYKEERVAHERNAHAFALSAVRKLREKGIDLLRGYSAKQIEGSVDFALNSYEKSIIGKLPGIPFSDKKRSGSQGRITGTDPE